MSDMMGKIGELLSDEESMRQLSELAQMFINGGNTENEDVIEGKLSEENDNSANNTDSDGIDIGMIMKIAEIAGMMNQSDKNSELLLALKPHLKAEKQNKVDKAIKLMKLISVFKIVNENGMLKDLI